MSPEGLAAWMRGNSSTVKTAEDFICCLPKSYRKRIFIAHASQAGQNGSPESPRVFFVNGDLFSAAQPQDVMILTVNGGAEYLNQRSNVEAAFYRAKSEKLEFYDGSIEGETMHLSGRNPEQCMICHGESGTESKYGSKSIFDPFGHWPRFVGGAVKCFPEEDKIQLYQQKLALKAVRDLPRFRCVDKEGIDEDIKKLEIGESREASLNTTGAFAGFDAFLFGINGKRVARIVRDTPDFEAYKYAIVGSEKCADFLDKFDSWIPKEIQKHHTQLATVSKAAASYKTEDDLKRIVEDAKARGAAQREKVKRTFEAVIGDKKNGLEPSSIPFACQNLNLADAEKGIEQLPAMIKTVHNDTLRKYFIDQMLKTKPLQIRGGTSAVTRYLFEGRGIDMSNWGMEPLPGEYKIGLAISSDLIAHEPESSVLKKWDQERSSASRAFPMGGPGRTTPDHNFCSKLRKASHDALLRLASIQKTKTQSSNAAH